MTDRVLSSQEMKMERPKCDCCGEPLGVQWSDTHGVACCITCGLPYTIYHYEDDKRVEKPPSVALNESGMEIAKRYWREQKARVFPGCYDMGFLGGRDQTYSGATRLEIDNFNHWYADNVKPEPAEAAS